MNNKKLYAMSLFLVLGLLMITSPSLRIYAADEQGSSGGDSGSNDGGGDSGGGDNSGDSGGDGGNKKESSSNDGEDKQETNEDTKESNDAPQEDKQETNGLPKEGSKGTPEEQEQAAVEDYIHEEPGIVKPYPPVTNTPKPGVGDIIKSGTPKINLKCSHTKEGCDRPGFPIKDGAGKGDWCKQHPGACGGGCDHGQIMYKGKGHDGCGGGGGGCHHDWNHKGDCRPGGGHGGGKGGGHHHNDWCDRHDCHNHHHHSSTHFSDSHHGDVTVKVDVKYDEESSRNLNDVHLVIGDVYEKSLDLSDKPDTVKVDNLDIDGGDSFAVCLANEDSNEGDCIVTEADNDHATETVSLTVF